LLIYVIPKDFSEEIERGVGGTVYKGVLIDNQVMAINKPKRK